MRGRKSSSPKWRAASAITGADIVAAGFVHGVLNTDNINITGESFDYGPWRFLPHYDPAFTAAYFDSSGLYAFGRQPDALAWNLTRLAECLLPLGDHAGSKPRSTASGRLSSAPCGTPLYAGSGWCRAATRKIPSWWVRIFAFLHESQIGYEQFWFDWARAAR